MVTYDDFVSDEHEELVERSVEAFEGLEGVESVVHEDREILLVHAPSLQVAQLERRLHGWWKNAVRVTPTWKEDLDAVSAEVGRALRAHGFRKRKVVFNRETEPGLVQVVAIERYRHDGTGEQRVDVSPGVWLEEVDRLQGATGRPPWISEIACHLRLQGGPRFDHPGSDGLSRQPAPPTSPPSPSSMRCRCSTASVHVSAWSASGRCPAGSAWVRKR